VVIGDLLIVTLATALAAATATGRTPIEAATSVFAITMATAVLAAAYTGLMHLTVFRNRARQPVPIYVAVGFHLSIGVLFLIGFAVGAAILDVPRLGSSPSFAIAVLLGGLLVCLPTSLLLDHSDRYRAERDQLTQQLTALEQLRISEWSMRQSLRSLADKIADQSARRDVVERLDVLDFSEDTRLSTSLWWQASQTHHQDGGAVRTQSDSRSSAEVISRPDFFAVVSTLISREFPTIGWVREFPTWHRSVAPTPGFAAVLVVFMVWLFLTPWLTSMSALPIGLTAAGGVYALYALVRAQSIKVAPVAALGIATVLGVISAFGWFMALQASAGTLPASALTICIATGLGVATAVIISMWVSGVVSVRNEQLIALQGVIDRRQSESTAVFASLTSIVAAMTQAPPLSTSTAIAACATGLQRIQTEKDPVRCRRIIDWTNSVLSAPGAVLPVSLVGRIDEVVLPWRALADISVDCPEAITEPALVDDIVAVVDEAVRNACRHGAAESISITVTVDPWSLVSIEILDDGTGPGLGVQGVGSQRFASLGNGGYEVAPRSPGPGTRVLVRLDPTSRPDVLL